EGWRQLLEGRRYLWYARGRQIAPYDALYGITSPFRLPSELPTDKPTDPPDDPDDPGDPGDPGDPNQPDDRDELERSVRVWAAGTGEEQVLLDLRDRSNDLGRARMHAMLGELIKRGEDLVPRAAIFELRQIESINGNTIRPIVARYADEDLGAGLPRVMPTLLGSAGESGRQLRLLTAGTEKIEIIKVVREFTGLGLAAAKEIVDSIPSEAPIGEMDDATLRRFVGSLRELGVRTELLIGGVGRATSPEEIERRTNLLIASMAIPELDQLGRKANDNTLQQVLAELLEMVQKSTTKPDILREAIIAFLR
ncbi:MAG: ribosomal protein L7/L12, partial [Pseudomonadota bacterium]